MSTDNAIPGGAKVAGTIITYRQAHSRGTIPTDIYELVIPEYQPLIPGTLRVRTDMLTSTMLLAGLFADFVALCAAVDTFSDLSKARAIIGWEQFTERYQHCFYALGGDTGLCAVELDGQVIDPEGRWDFQHPRDIQMLPPPNRQPVLASPTPAQGWRDQKEKGS